MLKTHNHAQRNSTRLRQGHRSGSELHCHVSNSSKHQKFTHRTEEQGRQSKHSGKPRVSISICSHLGRRSASNSLVHKSPPTSLPLPCSSSNPPKSAHFAPVTPSIKPSHNMPLWVCMHLGPDLLQTRCYEHNTMRSIKLVALTCCETFAVRCFARQSPKKRAPQNGARGIVALIVCI